MITFCQLWSQPGWNGTNNKKQPRKTMSVKSLYPTAQCGLSSFSHKSKGIVSAGLDWFRKVIHTSLIPPLLIKDWSSGEIKDLFARTPSDNPCLLKYFHFEFFQNFISPKLMSHVVDTGSGWFPVYFSLRVHELSSNIVKSMHFWMLCYSCFYRK